MPVSISFCPPSPFVAALRARRATWEAARARALVADEGRGRAGLACLLRDVHAGAAVGSRVRAALTACRMSDLFEATREVQTRALGGTPTGGRAVPQPRSLVALSATALSCLVGLPLALVGGLGHLATRSESNWEEAIEQGVALGAPVVAALAFAARAVDWVAGGLLQGVGCLLGAAVGGLCGVTTGSAEMVRYRSRVAEARARRRAEQAAVERAHMALGVVVGESVRAAEAAGTLPDVDLLLALAGTSAVAREAVETHVPVAWWRRRFGDNVPLRTSVGPPDYRRQVCERARYEQAHLPAQGADVAPTQRQRLRADVAPTMVDEAAGLLWGVRERDRPAAQLTLLALSGPHLKGPRAKRVIAEALVDRPLEAAYFARTPDDRLAAAWAALGRAWHGGLAEVLRLVVAHGVSVDITLPDVTACTPLHEAVQRGDVPHIHVLLEAGASPTVPALKPVDTSDVVHSTLLGCDAQGAFLRQRPRFHRASAARATASADV